MCASTAACEVQRDEAPVEQTTSVTRGYSDLHQGSFLLYAFGLCALRTAAQQPLNIALARKQTCRVANSLTTLQLLRHIHKYEGHLRGLARGMPALTLGCAASEVVYLGLFEYGREALPWQSAALRDAVAGYGADALCRCVHIPLSIVAFRQMTRMSRIASSSASATRTPLPRPRSALHTLRHMYAERGLRTVFAGYGTTLAVGCQWTALWWGLYGGCKAALYDALTPWLASINDETTHNENDARHSKGRAACGSWLRAHSPAWCWACDDNPLINTVASVATSALTAVVFNPYLVLRTNMQVTPHATLCGTARQLYRRQGLRGFYSGLALSIGSCIVDGALASTSYEYAKLWADTTRPSTAVAAAAASNHCRHSIDRTPVYADEAGMFEFALMA